MDETLKIIGTVIGILIPVGAFLYWHFNTLNNFKDEIHKLDKKISELEKKDDIQQTVIDNLNGLHPKIHEILEKVNNKL